MALEAGSFEDRFAQAPSIDDSHQAVLDFVKNNLASQIPTRKGIIKAHESFIHFLEQSVIRGPSRAGMQSEEKIEEAARIQAIERLLSFQTLQKINPWDSESRDLVVNFLFENYKSELERWIKQPDRLELDPRRVEEIEALVREKYGMSQSDRK